MCEKCLPLTCRQKINCNFLVILIDMFYAMFCFWNVIVKPNLIMNGGFLVCEGQLSLDGCKEFISNYV